MVIAVEDGLSPHVVVDVLVTKVDVPSLDNPFVILGRFVVFDVGCRETSCDDALVKPSELNLVGNIGEVLVSHEQTESLECNNAVVHEGLNETWVSLDVRA